MKNNIRMIARFISACLSLLPLVVATPGSGATYYWDPEGVYASPPVPAYSGSMSGLWENSLWSTAPGGQSSGIAWADGNLAVFGVGTGLATPAFTVTMNSDHTIAGLQIGRSTTYSCNVTLTGTGTLNLPAGTLQTFRLGNSPADGSQASLTINNVIGGVGSILAVTGDGKLFLHGANTFSGGLFLGAPGSLFSSTNIVLFNNPGAFGTGSITVSNTVGAMATLALEGSSALTITNAISVPASTANSLNITGNPAGLTFSGPWSLASTINAGSGGAANRVVLSGVLSGAGGLNKFGSGTMLLASTNSNTGGTTVSNGVLQLGDGVARNGLSGGAIGVYSPGSLVFANPTILTNSKVISGTGPVTYQGPGVLALSGANTYGGASTISGGTTVKLGLANALPSGVGKSDVSLAGTLDMAGFSCGINGLSGAGTVDNSIGTGTYTLTVGNNDASSTFSGIIKNTTGTNALTKTGVGTLTLSGANTYAGLTTVSAGTLQVGVNNAIPSGSPVLVSSGATLDMNGRNDTIDALSGPGGVINNNGTLTASGNAKVGGSQIFNGYSCVSGPISGSGGLVKGGTHSMGVRANLSSYPGPLTLNAGTLSVGAAPNRLPTSWALSIPSGATFQLDANNQAVSTLNGSGDINLGGGILTINQTGSDAFGGSIRDSDLIGVPTATGHGLRGYYYGNIDFTLLGAVRDDATVNFPDQTTFPGYASGSKTNQVSTRWVGQVLTTVAGDYVFTVRSDDGARLWVNGVLTVDSWILQGPTSHSGTNTLSANTRYDVVLEWFNNTGPGTAQLYWTPPGDSTAVIIPNANLFLPGPGAVVKAGNGTQQFNAANSYSGTTIVSAGTLQATVNEALGAGNVVVGSGASLDLSDTTTIGPNADVILSASANNVNLNFLGQNPVHGISLDGGATYGPAGTYGSVSSGATYTSPIFTGTGVLNALANPTTTALASTPASPATVVYGSTVTLTATVSSAGTPTGTVTFYDGTNFLGSSGLSSGVASLSVSNLTVFNSPHSITAVYSGDSVRAKSTSSSVSVSTTPRTITAAPLIALKYYDLTTNATIASANFTGVLPSDTNYVQIATNGYAAWFLTPYVGTNKPVNITGMTLAGSLGGNYILSSGSASVTGVITNRTTTVSGLSVVTRLYDSTTTASVTGTPALNNILSGDTVNIGGSPVAAFTTKAVGTGKAVTLTGYTITGVNATNYVLVLTNLTGSIVATNISVLGMSGNNKVYDGSTVAGLLGTPQATFFAGDSVAIGGSAVATFASANVGVGIPITVTGYTLVGSDAANYVLSQPTGISGSITPAATTATILSSLNPSTNGNSVTFTFTVTSTTPTTNPPTGSVTFKTNSVNVTPAVTLAGISATAARATFTTSLLPVGTTPVQGVYLGDSNFSAPTVPTVNQSVVGTGVCSQTNRILSVTSLGGGSFNLNLIGTYQAQYRIVYQTNAAQPMTNWIPVIGGTNTVSSPSGLWSITVTNRAPAYYRSQAMSGVCP
jgi:fibronectin-binding autotransporter adhesin